MFLPTVTLFSEAADIKLMQVRHELDAVRREGGELSVQHRSTVDMVADQRHRLSQAEEEIMRIDQELRGTEVYTGHEAGTIPRNLSPLVAQMREDLVVSQNQVLRYQSAHP